MESQCVLNWCGDSRPGSPPPERSGGSGQGDHPWHPAQHVFSAVLDIWVFAASEHTERGSQRGLREVEQGQEGLLVVAVVAGTPG